MPNCKFCGKPVISAHVMHAHCWEQKVMELMETVCDNYCRWPLECRSSEDLEENHWKRPRTRGARHSTPDDIQRRLIRMEVVPCLSDV